MNVSPASVASTTMLLTVLRDTEGSDRKMLRLIRWSNRGAPQLRQDAETRAMFFRNVPDFSFFSLQMSHGVFRRASDSNLGKLQSFCAR